MTIKSQSYYYEKALKLINESPSSRQTYVEITELRDEMAGDGLDLDASVVDRFIELLDVGYNSVSEKERLQMQKFMAKFKNFEDELYEDDLCGRDQYCGTSNSKLRH